MTLTHLEQQLLRVSKSSQRQLAAFRDGVYITSSTTRSLDDLRDQACADRLELAESFLKVGDRLMRARPPEYRSAIGRYYYAMYHCMRAVVFFVHNGDDHQKHDVLPSHTPKDLPNSALWENRLKDARSRRNDADYDPYPTALGASKQAAIDLRKHAQDFVPVVRSYLKSKGCAHV